MDDDTPDDLGVAPDMPREFPAPPRPPKRYHDDAFKAKAVKMVVEDGLSTTQVAAKIGVKRPMVTRWVLLAGHGRGKGRKSEHRSGSYKKKPAQAPTPHRPPVGSEAWEASLVNEKLAQVTLEVAMLRKMLMMYMAH